MRNLLVWSVLFGISCIELGKEAKEDEEENDENQFFLKVIDRGIALMERTMMRMGLQIVRIRDVMTKKFVTV